MVKVLHILEATEGGTRRHLRDLLNTLPASEYQPLLAVSCKRDTAFKQDLAEYRALGLKVLELDMCRAIAPWQDLCALLKIERFIRREKIAIVHAHSSKAGFLARVAATHCRVPVVYTPHCFPFLMTTSRWQRSIYYLLEKWVAASTSALLALSSEEVAAALRLGIAPAKIFRLQNGVAQTDFGGIVIRDSKTLKVGFFGRLTKQKGADLLLCAMREVVTHQPHVHLFLHGAGELEERLRRLAEKLEIGGSVTFAGAYQQADVVPLMREVDVLAIPSRWEGAPYVLLEAWQAGVPVAATSVGGLRDMLQHGVDGLCVATESVEALADALLQLLRDHNLRHHLAEQGRAQVKHYTLTAMADVVGAVYQRVLADG